MAEEKTAEELAAEAAKKAAADVTAQRASIKVISNKPAETDEEKTAREEAEATAAAEAELEKETEIEAAETKVEDHEQTEEELEAAKIEAKSAAEKAKIQRRIDREVSKRKVLEAEIAELKAKLAAEPDKANLLTEEEVEKRAETKAQQKALQREFDAASNRLFDAGVKADKNFQAKITAMAEDIGAIPGHLVGILDDLDNGGEILVHFTANPDEAEEVYAMSPAKAAVTLAKLSTKLEAAKKPAPKQISKVADPIETIKGGSKSPDVLPKDPTKNMDEFIRIRNKQAEQHRRVKLGLQ